MASYYKLSMNCVMLSNAISFRPVYSKLLTWLLVIFLKICDDRDEKNASDFIELSWMLLWLAFLFKVKLMGNCISPKLTY